MSGPAPLTADTDRNLLFGVLALQLELIDARQFADACAGWATRKEVPLADVLVERGWLSPADRQQVAALFERKVKRHGGNVHQSLAATADAGVRDVIRDVGDAALRQSLNTLPPAAGYVLVETVAPPTEQRSRYTLSRLHGEGGLGRVWAARDADLNREVALKELQPDLAQHPEAARRFLKEAQVTGQLEHPNIVPVYELARRPEDDQPFYTMRLVRGQTLGDAIADYQRRRKEGQETPLERPRLLQAFVSVCLALGYAHSRGVVHRDLKPANVVLGSFGEVIVLDWGLAKLVDQPDEETPAVAITAEAQAGATQAGRVLGTPAYMAPEQAEGRLEHVDARTDIYGLGAILFEILTGRPPHMGENTAAVLRRVIHGDTPRARSFEPSVPPALEAICARAMVRERSQRYAKASALAEDVQRWLADEPVSAYREPVLHRVRRWGRRHRPLVTGLAALSGATILALVLGLILLGRANRATQEAWHEADARAEQLRVGLYYSTIGQAASELSQEKPDVGRIGELLEQCEPPLRGWEWDYLKRQTQDKTAPLPTAHTKQILDVAYSPAGRHFATGGLDGLVMVTDATTGQTVQRLQARRLGLPTPILGVAFSPDGRQVAGAVSSIVSGEVRVWDVGDGHEVYTLHGHQGGVVGVAFSPDGRLLASAGWDKVVVLWDRATGQEVRRLSGHTDTIYRVAFSPDGRQLASVSWDGSVRLWDPATGQEVRRLEGGIGSLWSLAFSPDGRRLAAGNLQGMVRIWDTDTGETLLRVSSQLGAVYGLAFSRDGKRLACAGWDRTIRLCDAATGQDVLTLRGHTDIISALAFSPDGRRLVSVGWDHAVRVWDATPLAQGSQERRLDGYSAMVSGLAYDPSGKRLVSTSMDGTVRLWDVAAGREVWTHPGDGSVVLGVAFRPDGKRIAATGWDRIAVWDADSGQELLRYRGHEGESWKLAFSPDGSRIVSTAGLKGTVKVWDAESGKDYLTLDNTHLAGANTVAFSPDGRRLATGGNDNLVRIWDAVTGESLQTFIGHRHVVLRVCFSPDGQRLASASWDGTLKVWTLDTGQAETFVGHKDRVMDVVYSPDGKRLASASMDGTARLWEVATGKELHSFPGHAGVVMAVAFAPDGKSLAVGSGHRSKGDVTIWDLANLDP